MAKKSKKRQLETDSNVINENTDTKTDSPKKKLKVSPEKSEKKDESSVPVKQNDLKIKDVSKKNKVQNANNKLDVEASNNTVEEKKLKKKNKKKAKKQEKLENSAENNTAPSKTAPSDSNNEANTKSKRKEMYRKKREESKEKRKQTRQQGGLSATLSKLSLTDMKKRIADIESRETISKTAVRRLRILKKKVKVLESGGSVDSLNEKGSTSENTSKENKKNKFEKKANVKTDKPKVDSNKIINKKNKKKGKLAAKDLEKNLFIEDRVGDTAQGSSNDSNEEENGLNITKFTKNMKKLKKIMSGNSNIEKNNENEGDSNEDVDEDIDEDDDECENGSKEDINESDNEESDEDSNEGEDTIEKVKADKTTSVSKAKKAQNKFNQDSNKPKTNLSETDSNKKQRYVLFVGNIAYDATTVDLKKHFLTKVEKVKDVRIPLNPGTNKPRGFGYIEVENSEDYEKALSLHHTFVNGRQIKVEYTTSGSKKASRNPEVIHKNKKLHALRKEGKLAGSKKFSNKRSFRRNFKNNPNKGPGKRES